ncbi:MAG TPA: hypothetical protein VLA51_07565 [Paracoccaceae bacterium]|nr:hypothetical protein [Paracoccaceae bacterium]
MLDPVWFGVNIVILTSGKSAKLIRELQLLVAFPPEELTVQHNFGGYLPEKGHFSKHLAISTLTFWLKQGTYFSAKYF